MINDRIAILGATSHIAKNLIVGLNKTMQLFLFARSSEKVLAFLQMQGITNRVAGVRQLDAFGVDNIYYDAVINCIGYGTPDKLRNSGAEIQFVTERYDNVIIAYLLSHRSSTYVNFSSGAIYGANVKPVDNNTGFGIALGALSVSDAYRVAKLNSETKHRSMSSFSIIDLRLFSFFSRFIDLDSSYFMAELVRCIQHGLDFATSSDELMRDYVHPMDLCRLIENCIQVKGINKALDIYSLQPAKKSEIISVFQKKFGLKVRIIDASRIGSPTGEKENYFSTKRDAAQIFGYMPKYTSIESLVAEGRAILEASCQIE